MRAGCEGHQVVGWRIRHMLARGSAHATSRLCLRCLLLRRPRLPPSSTSRAVPSRSVPGVDVDAFTVVTPAGTTVHIRQATRGGAYRFGLDALLLATDVTAAAQSPEEGLSIVDLGAGCGVAGLCVALRHSPSRLLAVEVQPTLAALAEHNLQAAQQAIYAPCADWRVVHADVRHTDAWLSPELAGNADLVVCNPPFFAAHGSAAARTERQAGRQELHGCLADFLAAAAACLHPSAGMAKFVVPPARLAELLANSSGLHVHSLRFVHASPQVDAYLVEAVLRRQPCGGGGLLVRPALCVRDDAGFYTPEVALRLATAAGAAAAQDEVERIRKTCVSVKQAER